MKQSKSLLAVHFSGNSMTKETKEEMLNLLVSTSDSSYITTKTKFEFLNSQKIKERREFIENDVDSMNCRKTRSNGKKLRLNLYKQNMEIKLGLEGDKNKKYETINDRIVFYRFLGHLEIKDGQCWKLSTRCWICEKWKYT